MKYRTVLLFGAPGSGKGTQGRILGEVPDFFYFSCGDAFRNLRIDDPIGRTFIDYSSRGLLVPDETTINLWARNIQASTMDGSFNPARDTLILDGIPRNPKQAEMLKDTLDVKGLLHLACPRLRDIQHQQVVNISARRRDIQQRTSINYRVIPKEHLMRDAR